MFWDSMNDTEEYHQQAVRQPFSMDKENVPCSPSARMLVQEENSMFDVAEFNSPSRMSCDGSPAYSLSVRRRSTIDLHDANTQDSGYVPSEGGRPSPRKHFSFASVSEEFFDLSELENDDEHQAPAAQQQLPGEFSALLSGSLALGGGGGLSTSARRQLALIDNGNSPTKYARSRSSSHGELKSFKRPEPPTEMLSPLSVKRSRLLQGRQMRHIEARTIFKRSISNQETIKSAVHRSATEPDLIGDFSKSFCLPMVDGRHSDLKSVTAETLTQLLRGEFDDTVASYKIIDCRYPYEFDAGHIDGALNLYTKEQIRDQLLDEKRKITERGDGDTLRHILIFHCEFSSERGPNLSRFLRKTDREENREYYPFLHYPEVYLLDGGYKNFFETQPAFCKPFGYLPMVHPDHESNLKFFRGKSKTFNVDLKRKGGKYRI